MRKMILMVGNIGSGKTTYIKEELLADYPEYMVVSRDALRYMLGAGDYIFNRTTEKAVKDAAQILAAGLMYEGHNVVVDDTFCSKARRAEYIQIARMYNYTVEVIVFPKLTRIQAVNRRMKKPHGDSNRSAWNEVFEMLAESYEPPCKTEGIHKITKLTYRDIGVK